MIVAAASMGGWVVARYAAGSGIASAWHDPVFGRSLVFYFFELPFYTGMVAFLETIAVLAACWRTIWRRAAGRSGCDFPEFGRAGRSIWTACANWDALKPAFCNS